MKKFFELFKSNAKKNTRSSSLRFETLEDRQLLSVTDLAALAAANDNNASVCEAASCDVADAPIALALNTTADVDANDAAAIQALKEQGAVVSYTTSSMTGKVTAMSVDVANVTETLCVYGSDSAFTKLYDLNISGAAQINVDVDVASLERLVLNNASLASLSVVDSGNLLSIGQEVNAENTIEGALISSNGASSKLQNVNLANCGLQAFGLVANNSFGALKSVDMAGNALETLDLSAAPSLTNVSVDASLVSLKAPHDSSNVTVRIASGSFAQSFTAIGWGDMPLDVTDDGNTGFVKVVLNADVFDRVLVTSPDCALKINGCIDFTQKTNEIVAAAENVCIGTVSAANLADVKLALPGKTTEETGEFFSISNNGDLVYLGGMPVQENVQLTLSYVNEEPLAGDMVDVYFDLVGTPLGTPDVSVSEVTATSAKFVWDSVSNADFYDVCYIINYGVPTFTSTDDSEFVVEAASGAYVEIYVTAKADSEDYIASEEGYADATLLNDVEPAIVVDQLTDVVQNSIVNVAFANVEVSDMDGDVAYSVTIDGQDTNAIQVVDGQLVYASRLNLSNKGAYSVVVTATNGEVSVSSEAIELNVIGKMVKPQLVVTDVATDSISLDWQNYPFAKEFRVQYKAAGESQWTNFVASDSETTIDGLEQGVKYTVRVKAVGGLGASLNSDYTTVYATTLDPQFSVDEVVESVDFIASNVVVATFEYSDIANPTFTILDNGEETGAFTIVDNTIVKVDALTRIDSPHTVTVIISDGSGVTLSDSFVLDITGKLAKPVVTLEQVTTDGFTVSWLPVDGASAYSVQYVQGSGKVFTVVDVPADQLSCTVDGLDSNTSYRVRVKAIGVDKLTSSDGTYVNLTTAVQPTVVVADVVDNIDYKNDKGAVVATFSGSYLDGASFSFFINGEATDAFQVVGDTIVYVGGLTPAGSPFDVELVATVGEAAASDVFALNVYGKLAKPASTVSNVTSDGFTISWKAIENASEYSVQYCLKSSSKFSVVTVPAGETSVEISGLVPGKEYKVRVKAIGELPFITSDGAYKYFTTENEIVDAVLDNAVLEDALFASTGKLAKPVSSLDSVSSDGATISWNSVAGATAYSVQYALKSSNKFTAVEVSADTSSYTIEGLAPSQAYKVRVKALGATSAATSDGTYQYFTTNDPVKLAKPVTALSNVTANGATISWNQVDHATGYSVQYALKSSNKFTVVDVDANTTSFAIEGLTDSTDYKVRVKALGNASYITSDGGYQYFTTAEVVIVKLAKPVTTVSDVAFDGFSISWKPVANASGYSVQYCLKSATKFTAVDVDADTTSVSIDGLVAGKEYKVRVKAIGEGNFITSDGTYKYFETPVAEDAVNAELDDDDLFDLLAASMF